MGLWKTSKLYQGRFNSMIVSARHYVLKQDSHSKKLTENSHASFRGIHRFQRRLTPQRLHRVPQGVLSPRCPGDWMERAHRCQKLTMQPGCAGPKGKPPGYRPPRQGKQKSRSPLPKSPPSCNFQGTIQAPGSRADSARPERVQCPRPPVWVPTFPPARPRVPARDSYHVPRGGWSGSRAYSARSPAHPTGPARPWPRGSRGGSGCGFGTEGPQLSSGQLRGGRARRDALRLGLVQGVWANAHARSAVLRDPSRSLEPSQTGY